MISTSKIPDKILRTMQDRGYRQIDTDEVGALFGNDTDPVVMVDLNLDALSVEQYPYTNYTNRQNQWMHRHGGMLRFDGRDPMLPQLLDWFLEHRSEDDGRLFGSDRAQSHIDPTLPEYNFAQLFEEVFGGKHLHALEAEQVYFDRRSHRRYIDYVLSRKTGPVAIELNGEHYHHPLFLTLKQYASQLFKQNSLVMDGFQVFRWSNRGMADRVKFADQLRDYFGTADDFISSPRYRAERHVSFVPLQHQEQALSSLKRERQQGKNTSLVVLPTGTGKTEVFIEDFRELYFVGDVANALVIVPTTELRKQTIARIPDRITGVRAGDQLGQCNQQILVQTSAWLNRHYRSFTPQHFDYIVVDEAHRAAAFGLRRVLQYFRPQYLVGLTATDERLDKQDLTEIFGQYEVDLTLEEAIKAGLLPPIRAFRVESNINLADVRFNGKEFVKSDLNKTVLVPSRDQLIIDSLLRYFGGSNDPKLSSKQGIIFCVDIKHAKRMALLMTQHGLSAEAVSGSDRKGLDAYHKGEVRFLCACDLLNEGWNAPQTSVVIMARPTMSKVLYTQQLGRGTRHHPGKDALYVIDVVDSYGANLQPWSVHALLNIGNYQPFGDLIDPDGGSPQQELLILDQLWEGERRIEPINIFNFEREFGDLLNEEQLARELFISTGTVKGWVKKGELPPTRTLPFGNKTLNYFSADLIDEVRSKKGLKPRTDETRYEDFFEFLEQRDYTFSYKIAFLLAFLSLVDQQGEAALEDVCQRYQDFYQKLLQKYGKAEKEGNPLNLPGKLEDIKYLSGSILSNPFEKFERKRFIYHCKELSLIAFDSILWAQLTVEDFQKIKGQYIEDGKNYYQKQNITLDDGDFEPLFGHSIITAQAEDKPKAPAEVIELPSYQLPFFPDLQIACGHFKEGQHDKVEPVSIQGHYGKLDPARHFVACASGNSMNGGKNPIMDGDYLLLEFVTPTSAGSITGKTMVIEQTSVSGDEEYLLRMVEKVSDGQYRLKAQNPDYDDLEGQQGFRTLARLKTVLNSEDVEFY